MFRNMKIGFRLTVSYAVIVLLALLLAIVALTGLSSANKRLNDLSAGPMAADAAVQSIRIETNVAARTIREMLIDSNTASYPAYRQKTEQNIAMIEQNLQTLSASYGQQDGLPEKYSAAVDRWVEIGTNIMLEIERGNNSRASDMLLNQCTPALNELVSIAQEISDNTAAMQAESLRVSLWDTNVLSLFVIGLLVVAGVLSTIIGLVTTRSIVRPVAEVEYAAKQLSQGVLNTEIRYHSKDEVGKMAESMRESMQTLSGYINDIDAAMSLMSAGDFNIAPPTKPFVGDFTNIERSFVSFSQRMSQVLRTINQTADELSHDSQSVSNSAQLLAQGATEQAASVQELSSTITEISSQISQTAENSGVARQNTDTAANCVQDSNQQMQDMITAMNDINDKSTEIGKIIKTIDDIAFQTNILALNAAVEAARAGAAGKGFAVVADEVRNLAGKSAEAAKTTSSLIAETVQAVNRGTQMADGAAQAILRVVDATGNVTTRIEEIADTSSGQATAIRQVTIGVDQISSVVQQNSATAQESAASSEELSGRAQMLKDLVSSFKLRDDC